MDLSGSGIGDDNDDISFDVEWSVGSVTLTINNGESFDYWFGMAETDCGGDESCWQGEDCIYGDSYGGSGEVFSYCHPALTDGPHLEDDILSLTYGGNPQDLDEGKDPAFTGPEFESKITFYVEDTESSSCWVWGHDVSYYDGLGCQWP